MTLSNAVSCIRSRSRNSVARSCAVPAASAHHLLERKHIRNALRKVIGLRERHHLINLQKGPRVYCGVSSTSSNECNGMITEGALPRKYGVRI
jgi:hypothetical protein